MSETSFLSNEESPDSLKCPVCVDLRLDIDASNFKKHYMSEVQAEAQGGCRGCMVLSTILATFWEHYDLTDECMWALATYPHLNVELYDRRTYLGDRPWEVFTSFSISTPTGEVRIASK